MWGVKKVVIVLVVIGALDAVTKNFGNYVEKLEIDACVKIRYKRAPLELQGY